MATDTLVSANNRGKSFKKFDLDLKFGEKWEDFVVDNLKTADEWASTTTLEDDRDQMNRTKLKDGNIEKKDLDKYDFAEGDGNILTLL